jgi:uncharacterized membrane protein YcgQ (UPF0703/DUF1980 family)
MNSNKMKKKKKLKKNKFRNKKTAKLVIKKIIIVFHNSNDFKGIQINFAGYLSLTNHINNSLLFEQRFNLNV